MITSLVEWTALIYASILCFSCGKLLTYWCISLFYFVVNLLLLIHSVRSGIIFEYKGCVSKPIKTIKCIIDNDKLAFILCCCCISFVAAYGIVALFAVPYNYDSLTYHAPRICQWVQNKSVFYYATNIKRQNISTILAGYISTYMYVLTGKNQSALCWLQFLAYTFNAILVYSICKLMRIDLRYRIIGIALWLTLPIGFAEAITPMNDQFAATWFLAFVILLMPLLEDSCVTGEESYDLKHRILLLGTCIGFAYITKPAVCFGILVFLIWYLLRLISNCKTIKELILSVISQCIVAGIVIITMMIPQSAMNYIMTGNITDGSAGRRQLVGTLDPRYIFVNFIKNIIFNFGTKIGEFTTENAISSFLYWLADLLKIDLNNRAIAEEGAIFYFPSLPNYSCDAAINTAFAICILIAIAIIVIKRNQISKLSKRYAFASITSYIIFCFALRWESSISRYMVGYFAILVPVVAIGFQLMSNKAGKLVKSVLYIVNLLSVLGMLLYLVKIHPVLGNKSNFTYYHNWYPVYQETCDYINSHGYSKVGIYEGECSVEYPIWNLLDKNIEIRHINVDNSSDIYRDNTFVPDCIVSYIDQGEQYICDGKTYYLANSNECWFTYVQ